MARFLHRPPGVPAHLVEVIRTAFWETVNDPAFKQQVEKQKLPWSPMKGADIQKFVDDVLTMSPEVAAKVQKMASGK